MGNEAQIGLQIGTAFAQGVAQWKQLQMERQQKRDFEGAVQKYNLRIQEVQQAVPREEEGLLAAYEAQAQRYPGAATEARPTGNVNDKGEAEEEEVLRTPEGDIPLGHVQQLRAKKQQTETALALAQMDALMELQATLPDNPQAKQFVASAYAGIQAKLDIRAKQVAQQLALIEREQAQERIGLERGRLDLERDQFDAAPERAQAAAKLETDEGIRRDTARISAQKAADLEVEGVRAQGKPKAPTEYDKKLGQLAGRAQEALDVIDRLDYDRTGARAGVESLLPNAARSGSRQQLEQAQLQFVNSVLRAESGATITSDEIEKAKRQYFPQVGDSPEVVEQKRQARQTAVDEMRGALGEAPAERKAQPRSPDEVRALFKAGKLSRDDARAMLRTMGRQ
jgi:hypothetical protein